MLMSFFSKKKRGRSILQYGTPFLHNIISCVLILFLKKLNRPKLNNFDRRIEILLNMLNCQNYRLECI